MASELLRDLSRASDSNNNPLSGATWNFYVKGTTTPQAVYADPDLATSLGAVVTADGGGKFVPVYFNSSLRYRGILKTAAGATLDDIPLINSIDYTQNNLATGSAAGLATTNSAAVNGAILLALVNNGKNVHIDVPGTINIDRLIEISVDNIVIEIDPACHIVQQGTVGASSIFFLDGRTGVDIIGGHLTPNTTFTSTADGWAIRMTGSTNCRAINTEITGHRNGIKIDIDCTDCGAVDLYAHDAFYAPDTSLSHTLRGHDFIILNTNTRCYCDGGRSIRGCGVGFTMMTDDTPGAQILTDCWIKFDLVKESPSYGALAYKRAATVLDVSDDIFANCWFQFGAIHTVYGNTFFDSPGDPHDGEKSFGAGFYQQGTEGLKVEGNLIANTNIYTDSEQLAPAAYGLTNCRSGFAHIKRIEDPQWYGAFFADAGARGDPASALTADAEDNTFFVLWVDEIVRPIKAAVYQKDFPRLVVRATVRDPADRGFWSKNVALTTNLRSDLEYFSVLGGVVGNAGNAVQVQDGDLHWKSGRVEGYTGARCLAWQSTTGRCVIDKVVLDGHTGITLMPLFTGAGAGDMSLSKNTVVKTPNSGTYKGIVGDLSTPVRGLEDIQLINNAAADNVKSAGNYITGAGKYGAVTDLPAGTAPSIPAATCWQTTGVVTYTEFGGVKNGEIREILCAHAVTFQHAAAPAAGNAAFDMPGAANYVATAGEIVRFRCLLGKLRKI